MTKVVIVGNAGAGKSSMVSRLMGSPPTAYTATLGVELNVYRSPSNAVYNIWDCAGDSRYEGLGDGYYIGGDIFFIVRGGNGKTVGTLAHEIRRVKPHALVYAIDAATDLSQLLS